MQSTGWRMLKPWEAEQIEEAVRELVSAHHMSGPRFTALDALDSIRALTGAAMAFAMHVEENSLSPHRVAVLLIMAETYISEARKRLVMQRTNLLPREARNLLDRIQLATDKLDGCGGSPDDRQASLAAMVPMGSC